MVNFKYLFNGLKSLWVGYKHKNATKTLNCGKSLRWRQLGFPRPHYVTAANIPNRWLFKLLTDILINLNDYLATSGKKTRKRVKEMQVKNSVDRVNEVFQMKIPTCDCQLFICVPSTYRGKKWPQSVWSPSLCATLLHSKPAVWRQTTNRS